MTSKPNILFVDDETKMLDILSLNFSQDYHVFLAKNGLEAKTIIEQHPLDLIISDLKMPKMDGKSLLSFVKTEFPSLPFIIMTAYGTIEDAVEAIKNGAFDYVVKPLQIDELKQVVKKALHYYELLTENNKLKAKLNRFEKYRKIVTIDPVMKKTLILAEQVAKTNANVLITGESGTGKQLMAEFIHNMSMVAKGSFVEINAGAIPHELIESELFGHEKGAFTGAVQTKKGKFELADNGTIFLDEIGELPLDLQVKLLHVVEQNKLIRVGGTKEIPINVRLITATNRDLKQEIEKNNFRSDLYYRLCVVSVELPPLRQRQVDIPMLARFFMKKHQQIKENDYKIENEAMSVLQDYSWPGNIRELENIIQQAMIFSENGLITKEQLPSEIVENAFSVPLNKDAFQLLKKEKTEKILSALEFQFLNRLLSTTKGNISKASEISGYNRRQLQNLLSKHNINSRNYKIDS